MSTPADSPVLRDLGPSAGRSHWLAAGVVAAAVLAVLAEPLGQRWLLCTFKPLTTWLIIAYAWARGRASPAARRWLLAGLGCSLAGDIALLWPDAGFVPGLAGFLLAHLCYLVAFSRDTRPASALGPLLVYGVAAIGLLSLLWPGLPGPLRMPVTLYAGTLAAMAALAAGRWWQHRHAPHRRHLAIGALGGMLFVCSDGLLAFDRFHTALPWGTLWVLSTYWSAQWCIASSMPPGARGQVLAAKRVPPA